MGFGGSLSCNFFIEKNFVFHGWPDIVVLLIITLVLLPLHGQTDIMSCAVTPLKNKAAGIVVMVAKY